MVLPHRLPAIATVSRGGSNRTSFPAFSVHKVLLLDLKLHPASFLSWIKSRQKRFGNEEELKLLVISLSQVWSGIVFVGRAELISGLGEDVRSDPILLSDVALVVPSLPTVDRGKLS